jgi:hypothetical protein
MLEIQGDYSHILADTHTLRIDYLHPSVCVAILSLLGAFTYF